MIRKIGRKSFTWLFCLLLGSGCVAVPYQEFKTYDQAFTETKAATEKLLIEYDAANQRVEKKSIDQKSGSSPYPGHVDLSPVINPLKANNPVTARYDALKMVGTYNTLLITLAEGKSPAEVKTVADSLISSTNQFASLLGTTDFIPYAAPIGKLVATLVQKLEEAQNRKQFIAALKEGEPIVQKILDLFAEDAQDIYELKAIEADRELFKFTKKVTDFNRQIKQVALEYKKPSGEMPEKIQVIEKKLGVIYNRVKSKNSSDLKFSGAKILDNLVISQFEQTLVQAESAASGYEKIVSEQQAFYELIMSYGGLLGKTKSTLTIVRLAMDQPVNINDQAKELFDFVFQVKRDWDALDQARRSGGNQ